VPSPYGDSEVEVTLPVEREKLSGEPKAASSTAEAVLMSKAGHGALSRSIMIPSRLPDRLVVDQREVDRYQPAEAADRARR